MVLRLRAVVLALALSTALCAITPFNNVYLHATPLGGGHFPLAPFVVLVALTLWVAAMGRLAGGRRWLSGHELLFCWVTMALVSGVAYTGLVRTLLINLTAPFHFASVGNRWADLLHPLLPKSWYPTDAAAITSLYEGIAGGRDMPWRQLLTDIPWQAWKAPIVTWVVFIGLCYWVMICITNLLSRQWIENERMNFPLLQVPLMFQEAADNRRLLVLLSDRFLIAGVSIPFLLHLFNGLHFYYPSVPDIPTLILTGSYFPTEGIFSAFYKLKIYIYPAFIGFAFLAARQISFSFWFFFLSGGLLIGVLSTMGYSIPSAELGVTFGHTLTRPEETQMIGAYGVFFLFILWLARHHLQMVIRHSLGFKTATGADWFSIPLSFWGFFLGFAGLVAWCAYFGMPPMAGFLLVGAFFMVTIVTSRIICQGGVAYFTMAVAPTDGLLTMFGPSLFGHIGLLVGAVIQKVLFLDYREALMPSLFHTRKMTTDIVSRRTVLTAVGLALIIGVAVSFVSMLAVCYRFGIRELQMDWATRTTLIVYENVAALVETPLRAGEWVTIFSLVGAAVMLVLVVCYQRFYWWPIHPIGYLTAYSSAMRILWFSFLVGWACNALCMRYGGVLLFQKLRLFFIGLIIGDFFMGGVWALTGLFADASYSVLPT